MAGMAAVNSIIASPLTWIGTTFLFLILFLIMIIFLIVIAKKTHAIIEFKAWIKKQPICLFFQENRYVVWKPMKEDAGIITDKHYGAFLINERATYVDATTKAIIIPFDAQFGASLNMHATKLGDDLQYLAKDEEELKKLRYGIANNIIDENMTINVLKTSIQIGAIKTMLTALIPHNINAKIEKTIAARLKSYGQVNVPQIALLFVAVFGAILLGALIIKLAFPKT